MALPDMPARCCVTRSELRDLVAGVALIAAMFVGLFIAAPALAAWLVGVGL